MVQLPESSRFEDFSVKETARQLCLHALSLLRAVPATEFFNYAWFKAPKTVPHLKDLMLFSVDLSDWVSKMILEQKDVKDRVTVRLVDSFYVLLFVFTLSYR